MPKLRYSYDRKFDEERTVRAHGKNLPISLKDSVEICRAIRDKRLSYAKRFLEEVLEKKRAVAYRRFKKGLAHRRGLQRACAGAYPQKASAHILKLLKDAEANAEYRGLDTERLFIKHIQAKKGRVIPGYIPRAFGRATPHNKVTTHIEVWLDER